MSRQAKAEAKPLFFKKIFIVYNKESGLTESDFQEKFQEFGEIESVHIQMDKNTKKPKGYAFIHYTKTSDAVLAVEQVNNTNMEGNPRPIKVHLALDRKENLEYDVDPDEMLQKIFVRHKKTATDEELKEYFSQWGQVTWLYMLKDKATHENRGCAFVKFMKQSETARALEECDASYKPRWCDVRRKDDDPRAVKTIRARSGLADEDESYGYGRNGAGDMSGMNGGGYGGYGGNGFDGGMGGGYDSGMMGGGGGGGRFGRGFGAADILSELGAGLGLGGGLGGATRGGGVLPYVVPKQPIGSTKLEALVPAGTTREQAYNLFNCCPGLQSCILDQSTGNSIAKLEYSTADCSGFAKERIDGVDIMGINIAIRVPKSADFTSTAMELQRTLEGLTGRGGAGFSQMSDGFGGNEWAGDGADEENVPWCDIPLPTMKRANPRATKVAKVFVMCQPEPVPQEMLTNLFGRFGNLVEYSFTSGQRFGFANYSDEASAHKAVETCNNCMLFWRGGEFSLRVEMSNMSKKGDKMDTSDGPNAKRSKKW